MAATAEDGSRRRRTADDLAAAGKLVVQLHRDEILLLWNDGDAGGPVERVHPPGARC